MLGISLEFNLVSSSCVNTFTKGLPGTGFFDIGPCSESPGTGTLFDIGLLRSRSFKDCKIFSCKFIMLSFSSGVISSGGQPSLFLCC